MSWVATYEEVVHDVYFGVSGFGNGVRFMMCRPSQPYMCDHVIPLWDGALLITLVDASKDPHY